MRHFTRVARLVGISVLGLGVGLSLSACSPRMSSAAGTTTPSASGPATTATSPVAAPAPAVTATPATATPVAAPSAKLVPMQTAKGGEFLSPSGNISCEVNYHRAGLTKVYCQTAKPARSVTMGLAGRYTTCTGQQCLGNPGTGTPTLAYGTATEAGPFRCESATPGITCLASGKGFRISASGITRTAA